MLEDQSLLSDMKPNQLFQLSLFLAFSLIVFSACQSVDQQAGTSTAAFSNSNAGITGPPKVLQITSPRVTTATYRSIDRENSKFLKTVLVDYPIVRGFFEGDYTHMPSMDTRKAYVFQGPTKVTMQTEQGTVEESVTGTVFVSKTDFAKNAMTPDSLGYRFNLTDQMKEPVADARNRIKPKPADSAYGTGSFAAIAAAAVVNGAVSAAEGAAAAPVLSFNGNENEDFRNNYYGKNVSSADNVVVKFLSEEPAVEPAQPE